MIDGIAMHHGRLEDVLPTLLDSSVDHVITDPPYSVHVHKSVRSSQRNRGLADGNGKLSGCATRRTVDLGFEQQIHDDTPRASSHATASRRLTEASDREASPLLRKQERLFR